MEDQITVRLPRTISKALKEKAAKMHRKPSELVRMAVSDFLQITDHGPEHSAERVKNLIGAVESGVPDMATRHREYLIRKLRRVR